MINAIFTIEIGRREFRQYITIKSFCIELSKRAGVGLDGQAHRLNLLVPFDALAPDLFDVAELNVWFKDHVRGPEFAKNMIQVKPLSYLSDADRKVQKEWRIKAEAELRHIIGHFVD